MPRTQNSPRARALALVGMVGSMAACADVGDVGRSDPGGSVAVAVADQSIIGGRVVAPGQIPSMAMIGIDPELFGGAFIHWCGATVVAERWVTTAAHCLELFPIDLGADRPVEVTDLRIVVTQLRISAVRATDLISVEAAFVHAGRDAATGDRDIALLRTSAPIPAPAMPLLTRPGEPQLLPAGRIATTAGWGATNPTNIFSSSNALRAVDVPIVDRAQCDALYDLAVDARTPITPNMVCAGDTAVGGIDACVGDSGGPLFIAEAGQHLLAGTVSFGEGCAQAAFPGVYARAAAAAPWANACITREAACAIADHTLPPIHPRLRCVSPLGAGRFRAHFGYTSEAALSLAIPPGPLNAVLGGDARPPTVFAPGAASDAFTAEFRGAAAWLLVGPDGIPRAALASFLSPRC
jgi:trypsin